MRKYIILVFLGFYIGNPAKAASISDSSLSAKSPTMGISLSPLQLFLFSIQGKYYLKLHDHIVLTVPFVIKNSPELGYFTRSHYHSAGSGLKYYFTGDVFKGFYSEVELAAGYSILTPHNKASFTSAFLKSTAYLGYSWCFGDRFVLSLAGGAFYNHAFSHEAPVIKKATTHVEQMVFASAGLSSGFGPTGEISLGYNW